MTKRNTKNALISSVLALVLCFTMLLGTTYAWFTDSVTSANNIITAGNLDIELEYSKVVDGQMTEWKKVQGDDKIFDPNALWEPGRYEVVYLRVSNLGSLALKYQLSLNVYNEVAGVNVYGEEFKLSDHLVFNTVEMPDALTTYAGREDALKAAGTAMGMKDYNGNTTALEVGGEDYVALIVYMPTEVGNAANYKTGTAVPSISFGINLLATQQAAETDSFGTDYDAMATYINKNAAGAWEINNLAEFLYFAKSVNEGNYYEGETVVLNSDIDLAGINWTPIGSMTADHGFMGNFDGQNNKIKNLTIMNPAVDSDGYAYAGLFGLTEGAADAENVVKNLTIENVTINTTGSIVSAAIAYAYYTTVENITVCGDIAIKGGDYTSGALAYTRRCTTASNVTVSGNPGSYITGRDTVGGVISDIQTNGGIVANYSNFSVSGVTITGANKVGGISGIICNQTLNGATVKNVVLVSSDARVGIVSGCFDTKPNINNVTYENVTGTTSISGAPYGNGANAIVYIDGVEYVGNFETFKAYFDAKKTTINLACDITGVNANNTLTIAAGQELTLNLGGNKLSATANKTGNQELFLVKGNMTVVNGTIELVAENNQAWNAMATIFDVTAGGSLTMENVTANVSGTDMNFIVHLNNWGTASLYVDNCDFTASYVAIRAFNSGYDMNTVTVKNTDFHSGRVFWVHNYTSEGKDDSTLDLDIYGNGNTTDNAKPVRFGFDNEVYYDINGNVIA